jgi:copper chaperone NosL
MSYQPPVIGYKDLLNFRALSIPDLGGWIIVAVGTIAFMALAFHWFSQKKIKNYL